MSDTPENQKVGTPENNASKDNTNKNCCDREQPTRIAEIKSDYVDTTMTSRYEMKYLIPATTTAAIDKYVSEYLPLDRYSKLYCDGFYNIVSLYLDSPDLRLCRESLTGVLNRYKLRIRAYNDDSSYPHFFEIKRRTNTVIIKSRAKVRAADTLKILAGQYIPPAGNNLKDAEKLRQFMLQMQSIRAAPVVLIRYTRKAYEGASENRVRITFDKDLTFRVDNSPCVQLGGLGWQRNNTSLEWVILEIKFTGRFPAWLNRMVEYFNLQQRSVSKYTTSVKNACLLKFCAPKLPIMKSSVED